MKLLVIGIGDCGCRLADELAQLDKRARAERSVTIVTRAYAVNTEQASLASLTVTDTEALQPIHIEAGAGGYVGELSETGAEFIWDKSERVMASMRAGEYFETDAFLLVAGGAGSLGSGGVPVIAQLLKERYVGKPIYALIVLPFKYEEAEPRCVYNTAVCLKSVSKVADAVFLADNERFMEGDVVPVSMESMLSVNKRIISPFFDLLCASEMTSSRYAGAIALGVGEIVQVLGGWTVIGGGETHIRVAKFPWKREQDFRDKGSETLKVMEAMGEALGGLSTDCRLQDASRALYLLSVPSKGANIDMTKALGTHLREVTESAEIRGGDFYGAKDSIRVTVALSQLDYVARVKDYYDRAINIAGTLKKGKGSA